MHDLKQIIKMNEDATQKALEQELDDGFQVRADGLLEGMAAAAQHKPPLNYHDAVRVLAKAGVMAERELVEIHGVTVEDLANSRDLLHAYLPDPDKAAVLPVLLPDRVLGAINQIEDQFLAADHDCLLCPTFLAGECGGVLYKGDMLLGILRLAMALGVSKLLDAAADRGGEPTIQEPTATELFNRFNQG